jgi:hypothetical protein
MGFQTEIIPGLNPQAIIVHGPTLEVDIFLFGYQEVYIINIAR